jgi:hypothetical protein
MPFWQSPGDAKMPHAKPQRRKEGKDLEAKKRTLNAEAAENSSLVLKEGNRLLCFAPRAQRPRRFILLLSLGVFAPLREPAVASSFCARNLLL